MKKGLFIFGFSLILTLPVLAQDREKDIDHTISFSPQFFQIKDELNYGLVHNGLNLKAGYNRVSQNDQILTKIETSIGFGVNYNQGLGMAWTLKPIDYFYGLKIRDNKSITIILGPYMAATYQWHLYPELQSGHMSWMSHAELGPEISIALPWKGKKIQTTVSSSSASLASRPDRDNEEYHYSLTLLDFAKNPHTNLKFGSLNILNHLNIQCELLDPSKKMSVVYEFDYLVCEITPSFKSLSHSVKLKWRIRNEN